MIGVILLAHLGLLDLDLLYVNPTFLRSALIGGGIMGASFIVGGFCPGTSICALATGKIDAFWFIFGSFIGIFIFMEYYASFESLYLADNMGNLRMDKYFSMPKELFAVSLTAMAVLAFFFTQKIQNKLHGSKPVYSKETMIKYSFYAILPFMVIAWIGLTPDSKQRILNQANSTENQNQAKEITADKLAMELTSNYYKINLIDVRSPLKFKEYHLPLAINIPLDSMLNREWQKYFSQKYKTNVFYADSPIEARKAYIIAKKSGQADCFILRESTSGFKQIIVDAKVSDTLHSKEQQQLQQFRAENARIIFDLDIRLKKQLEPEKKVTKKVKGGCS